MKGKRVVAAMLGLGILLFCAQISVRGVHTQTTKRQQQLEIQETKDIESKGQMPNEARVGKHENREVEAAIAITKKNGSKKQYNNAVRNLHFSYKDYQVLERIVEAEATGGTKKSKMMVANVVLNRVKNKHFPNTIHEVVFQRCEDGTAQFSPISDGRYYNVTIQQSTKEAVDEVLKGKDISKGALFFVNRKSASYRSLCWFDSSLRYMFECGGHSYYCYRN